MAWTVNDIPDQSGRVALITGANSGLGLEMTFALAARGATVVMACRSVDRAELARARVLAAHPQAQLEVLQVDVSDGGSLSALARRFCAQHSRLDVLVHNAGLAMPPLTRDAAGREIQLVTNSLAPYALTGHLLVPLMATEGARVVSVASLAHRFGKLDLEDLHWTHRRYRDLVAYGTSKQALLLFAYELQRRLARAGAPVISVASHPGYATTSLPETSGMAMTQTVMGRLMLKLGTWVMSQSAAQGALPLLYAATAPDVQGGDYIGPAGFKELNGPPTKVQSTPITHDRSLARQWWDTAAALTGVRYLESP